MPMHYFGRVVALLSKPTRLVRNKGDRRLQQLQRFPVILNYPRFLPTTVVGFVARDGASPAIDGVDGRQNRLLPLLRCVNDRLWRAPWQGGAFQWVQVPAGKPLQPEATGAAMEETKWLKPSGSVSRIGDSASVQAVTRVNAEQASKRTMRRPTWLPYQGRLTRLGYRANLYAQSLRRGSGDSMYTYATREAPWRGQSNDQLEAREGQAGRFGVVERFVVPLKLSNAGGRKGPQFKTDATRGEGPGRLGDLLTPGRVQDPQMASHAKTTGVRSCPRAGCGK